MLISHRHKFARVAETARPLAGTALRVCTSGASACGRIHAYVGVTNQSWIAAFVLALFVIKAAIALLADFHNFIAAECALRSFEAIPLLRVFDGVQHIRNISNGACGEFAVVRTIAAGCTRKHDVVAAKPAWPTVLRKVVL